jgi:drug/metabolite transporter (DMT)-like permease
MGGRDRTKGRSSGPVVDREGALALTLISVAVGLVLAVGYHLLSMRFQSWVSRRSATMTPAIVMLGFLVRLTLIAVILVVLGLWSPLNILAVCIAFIVVFTALTAYSLYVFAKRRGAPPQAGAGSTK